MLDKIIRTVVRSVVSGTVQQLSALSQRVDAAEQRTRDVTAQLDGYLAAVRQDLNTMTSRCTQLFDEVAQLKKQLPTAAAPSPAYYANVLFRAPLSDRDGRSLKGFIDGFPYDFTVECTGSNGLMVLNSIPSLSNGTGPAFINLEVRGTGTLSVILRQTIDLYVTTSVNVSTLCTVAIHPGRSEYIADQPYGQSIATQLALARSTVNYMPTDI